MHKRYNKKGVQGILSVWEWELANVAENRAKRKKDLVSRIRVFPTNLGGWGGPAPQRLYR